MIIMRHTIADDIASRLLSLRTDLVPEFHCSAVAIIGGCAIG